MSGKQAMKAAIFALAFYFELPTVISSQHDVILTTSSHTIQPGLTLDLSINCSFTLTDKSDLGAIYSMILLKSSSTDLSNFSEVAIINSMDHETVNVKTSLGAGVQGNLDPNNGVFIEYQWYLPTPEAAGRYRCVVYGMDRTGHPASTLAEATISKEENGTQADLTTLLEKLNSLQRDHTQLQEALNTTKQQLHAVQSALQDKTAELNITEALLVAERSKQSDVKNNLTELQARLNHAQSGFFEKSITYGGHEYYLSYPSHLDIGEMGSMCRLFFDGHLVEPDGHSEYTAVANLIKSSSAGSGTMNAYLGLFYDKDRGVLTYGNGTVAPYSQFKPTQTVGVTIDHLGPFCVAFSPKDGLMGQASCVDNFFKYVCEVE